MSTMISQEVLMSLIELQSAKIKELENELSDKQTALNLVLEYNDLMHKITRDHKTGTEL